MIVPIEKPGTPAELAHHGVKGMKWGVRRAYADRQTDIANREIRVGVGGGTVREKLRTHAETPISGLLRGPKRTATRRGMSRVLHAARIEHGEATVRDHLKMYGNLTLRDIHKGLQKQK